MEPRVLKGSKQEIIEQLARIDGDVCEVIVFTREPGDSKSFSDQLATMAPWAAHADNVDDSREAIYRRMKGE